MKNTMKTLLAVLVLALASIASAQTVITSTTLAVAATSTANTITVTSATGFVAGRLAFVNRELVYINSVSGTSIRVTRGYGGVTSSHKILAPIWVQVPNAFRSSDPSGQCVRTNELFVPWINTSNSAMWDCVGVTTAGQWTQTDRNGTGVIGSTVASATSITPTGTFFVVSGTTAVATIAVPAGAGPGFQLSINPSGVFATTTAGNIGLVSSATVVGRIMVMTWDGSKWWPSYVL